MHELQSLIDEAWENRTDYKPGTAPARLGEAVDHVLNALDPARFAWKQARRQPAAFSPA